MNRLSQLGNKQPTDNRHYTLKISGFVRFVVNLEKMNNLNNDSTKRNSMHLHS